MGTQESKPTLITHDHVVNLINAQTNGQSEANRHAEKAALALETIVYTAVVLMVAAGLYLTYKLIRNYERMRGRIKITENVHHVKAGVV